MSAKLGVADEVVHVGEANAEVGEGVYENVGGEVGDDAGASAEAGRQLS